MPIPDAAPIVVAPTPTPFRADDTVDYAALERNIERWLSTPLSGFVLTTANGEELALSESERIEIVRVAAAAHGGQRFTIAGIDNPSTHETLRLADCYAAAGSDMVRVRVPRGIPNNAVESYFGDVTRHSPLPVVVIHQTFSGQPAASPETLGAVCAMDNVAGYITDHDIRFEGYVRAEVPDDMRFWICNGGLLAYGALMGANGACMWLGNIAPALCIDIMSHGIRGEFAEARRLQESASKLDRVIIQYGTPGVKEALRLLGYEGMMPRMPMAAVDADASERIRLALVGEGLPV
ncbi:MAG: dihydrodipicolinate synthase family protein [Chloroflexi bacterium]|nr:dihydrodipicolinate synthase family protein [Chloroflexota bacterium]